jgi:hypothetical protein
MWIAGVARTHVCMAALLVCGALVSGRASEPAEGSAATKLTVRPMPAPKPALKYQLLPEVGELNPGNAAQWYLRCFAEQRNFFFSKSGVDERNLLLTQPLSQIPIEKFRNYGGSALTQADWAARLDTVDWQVVQRLQSGDSELLQPELGPLHVLGIALRARTRVELAAHHPDDAVRTIKTLFAFARHLGENPTEAANRLGLKIESLALDAVEEMIQQPESPNLYWALTSLPSPIVELRKGMQGSGVLMARTLKPIRDDAVMSSDEIEKVVAHLSGVLGLAREEAGKPPRSFRSVLAARCADADQLRAARKRLLDAGVAEGLVPNFPPLQTVLLDAKLDYEQRRDNLVKLLAIAPWQIAALSEQERKAGAGGLLADFLPSVTALRQLQCGLEQRIALLRCVEALRMFAAEHGGKLPHTLGELGVPPPSDPITGKVVAYEVDGKTARLGTNWTVTLK